MKGFLKRDFMYVIPSLLIVLFIMVAVPLVFNDESGMSVIMGPVVLNISVFTVIVMGGVMELFQVDEQDGWIAYAAAIADGRRNQVNARYLLMMLWCLITTGLASGVGFLMSGDSVGVFISLTLLGISLFNLALAIPMNYRFGARGGLIAFLLSVVVILVGLMILLAIISEVIGHDNFNRFVDDAVAGTGFGIKMIILALVLVLVGLAAYGLSYFISRRIMARKEL